MTETAEIWYINLLQLMFIYGNWLKNNDSKVRFLVTAKSAMIMNEFWQHKNIQNIIFSLSKNLRVDIFLKGEEKKLRAKTITNITVS